MDWLCGRCGAQHELPQALAFRVPDACMKVPAMEREGRIVVGDEICVIDNRQHFVRCVLDLPLQGFDESFLWTPWVELPAKPSNASKPYGCAQ